MLLKDKLAAFAVVFIWGINFYFMKVGVSEISPMMLGCLRYILVLIPLYFLFVFHKSDGNGSWHMGLLATFLNLPLCLVLLPQVCLLG